VVSETPAEYLARIGAKGGAKSRRKLSAKEARRIAMIRWKRGSQKKSLTCHPKSPLRSPVAAAPI